MPKFELLIFFHDELKLNYQHYLVKAILLLKKDFNITIYDKHGIISNKFIIKNKLNLKIIKDFETLQKKIHFYELSICSFYQDIFKLKNINKELKILNVWHGSPIRKICFDNEVEKKESKLNFEKKNVYHIVQNEFYLKIFQKAFETNRNNVMISNFFYTENLNLRVIAKKVLKNVIRFLSLKKKILFCPTHDPNYANKDFLLRFPTLKNIINSNNEKFTIYIKQHELDLSVINPDYKNIKLLPKNYDLNNNFYLFDFFITDISSSIIDWFNITKRKFWLIKPNELYLKNNASYFDLNELYMDEKNELEYFFSLISKKSNSFYSNFTKKIIASKNNKDNFKKIIYKLIYCQ